MTNLAILHFTLQGYDGLVKTTSADLAAIFAEISWTQGTPSAEATIAKYGDVNGNNRVDAGDFGQLRKSIARQVELTNKQKLTGDVDDNARIGTTDYGAVRQFIGKKISEFKTVTDKK